MKGDMLSLALHGPGSDATATFWHAGQLIVRQLETDSYDIYKAFEQMPINTNPLTSYTACVNMLRSLGVDPEKPIWH